MSLTLKLALSPLLVAQALRTRARVPRLPEASGARRGTVGTGALALRLLIVGDSSAAGVGVASQRDALAGQLARELAARLEGRVMWQLIARSGITTAQALALLDAEHIDADHAPPADVAVLVTGVNDVVDQVPSQRAMHARERLVNHLRNRSGVQHVVCCPLPPIHQFPALPQPLRWVAGADAQRHNRALASWARHRAETLGDVSLPDFSDLTLNRGVMAHDGFHPGERAYRQVAHAVAMHIAAEVWPRLAHRPTR